jgi:major membrane immunogen (membrane-anchored lipoprotein)
MAKTKYNGDSLARQRIMGFTDERLNQIGKQKKGQEMNVGPNMGREDKKANKKLKQKADAYDIPKEDLSELSDAYVEGTTAGKIRGAEVTGPTFKKGGSVKSKASKRADGCCVRGKTMA